MEPVLRESRSGLLNSQSTFGGRLGLMKFTESPGRLRKLGILGGPAFTEPFVATSGRAMAPVQNSPPNGNNTDTGLLNVSAGLLSEI